MPKRVRSVAFLAAALTIAAALVLAAQPARAHGGTYAPKPLNPGNTPMPPGYRPPELPDRPTPPVGPTPTPTTPTPVGPAGPGGTPTPGSTPPASGGTPPPTSAPPSPTVPLTGGSPVTAPGSRRSTPRSSAEEAWETWWALNRWALLPDRDASRAAREETSPATQGVGRAGDGAADGRARARERAAEEKVLPFLREVLDPARGMRDDVVASALLAIAKTARDRTAVPTILHALQDREAPTIVRESAALAVGMLRRSDRSAAFDGTDLDRLRERLLDVVDDGASPDRVRAFAALSLGLLADQPYGSDATAHGAAVVSALWERLGRGAAGLELPVALLTALGMQPTAGLPEGVRDGLHALAQGRRVLERDWSTLERSHAVTAIARLAAPGCDAFLRRVLGRRSEDAVVRRAAWIGLGARADRMDAEDRREALRLALRCVGRERDPLTTGLALVGVGRLAGAELRSADPDLAAVAAASDRLRKDLGGAAGPSRGFAAIALAFVGRGATAATRDVAVLLGEGEKALVEGLRSHDDARQRGACAVALGLLGGRAAVGSLLEIVEDRRADDALRGHCAVALGQVGRGSPEVLRGLQLALAERRSEVLRREAALGLALLGTRLAATQLLREFRDGRTEHLLAQLAVALGRLDDLEAVDALIEVARDRDRGEVPQALAVVSLGLLADPEGRPTLSRLWTDANYPARTDALHEAFSIL